jgi:predicted nucleotidyltransferase
VFDESQIRSKAWIVREIIDLVLQYDNLKVEKICLIGSYAQGRQNEWSDLDFLVQLKANKGRLYPTWQQVNLIHNRLGSDRIHIIYGTLEAQESLFKKEGNRFKYREIPLSKESLC